MRLSVKANIPLNIRMCLECPFYCAVPPRCVAGAYFENFEGSTDGWFSLADEDVKVIPDKCPLIAFEEE